MENECKHSFKCIAWSEAADQTETSVSWCTKCGEAHASKWHPVVGDIECKIHKVKNSEERK